MELRALNVSKNIGNKVILQDVNLKLESGNIYGFVGRNGSGKTMLFRALSGLMQISSGEIYWNNQLLHRDIKVIPYLGIVLENAGLYPELTGKENLTLLARLNHKIGEQEIEKAIERVGLDPKDKRTYRKYSLGMKQRIVLAQAIMEKPDVLMLDEPTNSLDEVGVELIRNVIMEEKKRGALVLIASHNREDIEMLADVVFEVKSGVISERTDGNEI